MCTRDERKTIQFLLYDPEALQVIALKSVGKHIINLYNTMVKKELYMEKLQRKNTNMKNEFRKFEEYFQNKIPPAFANEVTNHLLNELCNEMLKVGVDIFYFDDSPQAYQKTIRNLLNLIYHPRVSNLHLQTPPILIFEENLPKLQNLKVLKLNESFSVRTNFSERGECNAYENLTRLNFIAHLRKLTKLEELSIPWCTDDYLENLSENCPQLKELSLPCCGLSEKSLEHFLKFKNLEVLCIYVERHISSFNSAYALDLGKFLEKCSDEWAGKVSQVNFGYYILTYLNSEQLASTFRNLTTLSLQIFGEESNFIPLKELKLLKEFSLIGTGVQHFKFECLKEFFKFIGEQIIVLCLICIKNVNVIFLQKFFPKLIKLSIWNCFFLNLNESFLDELSFEEYKTNNVIPKFESLKVLNCTLVYVPDPIINNMLSMFVKLEELDSGQIPLYKKKMLIEFMHKSGLRIIKMDHSNVKSIYVQKGDMLHIYTPEVHSKHNIMECKIKMVDYLNYLENKLNT